MLKLNLLPPQEKKKLELIRFGYLAVSFGSRLIVILIIFTLILSTTYFCLIILIKGQSDLIEIRQSEEKAQRQIEIEEKIKQANQEARRIYVKQDELTIWTPIFEELSRIVPSQAYLTNFSYRSVDDRISIAGWTIDRNELLTFENSLKESPYFEEIDAPLSNLIKQTDINFGFTFKPNSSLGNK